MTHLFVQICRDTGGIAVVGGKCMAVKSIVMIGDERLRETSVPVVFKIDPVERYVTDLRDTLHALQKEKRIGRAIAGPQIAYLKQIIYMETDDKRIVMVNPLITEKSRETFEVWDSCFSADVAFFGKTVRHRTIAVDYMDENGVKTHAVFRDDLSELFQHEIDHLDGVLFTDHIVDNKIIMRSEWEKIGRM